MGINNTLYGYKIKVKLILHKNTEVKSLFSFFLAYFLLLNNNEFFGVPDALVRPDSWRVRVLYVCRLTFICFCALRMALGVIVKLGCFAVFGTSS